MQHAHERPLHSPAISKPLSTRMCSSGDVGAHNLDEGARVLRSLNDLRFMPALLHPSSNSGWSFSLRESGDDDLSEDSDDTGSQCCLTPAEELERLARDIDLSSREDCAQFKQNPWTIAKINAATRKPDFKQTSAGGHAIGAVTSAAKATTRPIVKENGQQKLPFPPVKAPNSFVKSLQTNTKFSYGRPEARSNGRTAPIIQSCMAEQKRACSVRCISLGL